ncbi:MAG TPA: hypothetical protein VJM33_02185 [Microthrixaceae bacterium]|nr:hypothetical protein [Microthrixaceae bacterium]
MEWLVLSVVLTLLLNVAIRLWPGPAQRGAERLVDWTERQEASKPDAEPGRVRVFVPWKAMLIVSIGLTIVLNVGLRLF